MNKLKTVLFAVVTLMFTNLASADNSNFAGPYIGLAGSALGVEMDGSVTSGQDDVGETTTGTIGKTAVIAGAEIGYAIPLGSSMLLDIGASWVEGGAKMKTTNDDTAATADVTFEVEDVYTLYIAPTVALSDTSSLFFKVGLTEGDTKVSGDVTKPGDLSGTTVAVGTRTVLDSGIFIRAEAGVTDFNAISSHGKNEGGTGKAVATNTSVSADPSLAFGTISLGFRF